MDGDNVSKAREASGTTCCKDELSETSQWGRTPRQSGSPVGSSLVPGAVGPCRARNWRYVAFLAFFLACCSCAVIGCSAVVLVDVDVAAARFRAALPLYESSFMWWTSLVRDRYPAVEGGDASVRSIRSSSPSSSSRYGADFFTDDDAPFLTAAEGARLVFSE